MPEEPKFEYWSQFHPPRAAPTEDGWYPVIRIFEVEEGGIPDAEQWYAGAWATHRRPCVVAFGPRHQTEAEALNAAVQNDQGW
jgi:hypothetical protein